ncbi:uncharacterized protein LOC101859632 [Aplysia californica]|uniref:Uncharacterized protein LOC101859632 n=1 Tax=Aplysia californica TaxID=6500 RepID=A0ABM0ZYI4_APLCA|nr:uncharacterized protein LOC101859632 [Aplysia californica]
MPGTTMAEINGKYFGDERINPKVLMFPLEITGENLEDLLAYDDLFLDYFNHFLALPVFPQALLYNRLTGAFDEVEGLRPEALGTLPTISPSLQYGPTDAERERMLEWAREERLPLFLRTQLFRELKMAKLLLRPLEFDRQSASRGSSRNLRGYSRATESYISTLSVSGDQSGNDLYDYDDIWGELNYSALYRWQRPGSHALSLPTRVFFGECKSYGLPSSLDSASTHSSERSTIKALSAITSRRFGAASTVQFAEFPEKPEEVPPEDNAVVPVLPSSGKTTETARQRARISNKVEVIPTSKSVVKSQGSKSKSSKSKAPASSTEEAFLRGARVLSAPVNYEQYLKMPRLALHDFEALFGEAEPELGGQAFVQFDEEGISEEQTETDMRNMEGRLKMTVQQVKEKILGSHDGFEEFREFLQGTMGEHLLAFWLDCENYKDTMEDFDDIENMEIRNAHFRDIQDKYKLKLTTDAREQITRAASNMGLSHTIFLRTQYDVLRRLRAYWMPRFLIHCHRTRSDSLEGDETDQVLPSAMPVPPSQSLIDTASLKPARPQNALFPCISLVHSMPVLPEDARDYANRLLVNVAFENSNSSARRMFPRQRSTMSAASRVSTASVKTTISTFRSTKERFLLALAADRLAGGPFQRYLAKLDDPQLLASLLFWEDVTEYGATEDRSSDRLLRLCHAWNIYNKYLSLDSPHRIDLPEKERTRLQRHLEKAREMLEASIFDRAKTEAVEKLERAWVRYLKEDLKTFLDCRVKAGAESPPSTADAIEITVTEYDVVIKRPRPWVRRLQPLRYSRKRNPCSLLRFPCGFVLTHSCVPYWCATRHPFVFSFSTSFAALAAQIGHISVENRCIDCQSSIHRKVPGSTSSERARRLDRALNTAGEVDEERRAQKRAEALARRKAMERERRKAIRAAQARQKEARRKKTSGGSAQDKLDEELPEGEEGENAGERQDKVPSFADLSGNRQIMSMFRKFVSEAENKDVHSSIQLYSDIETYFSTKESKVKKDAAAATIYKTYLDPQGKRHTTLPEKVAARVAQEKDRPKTPLLREIQRSVLPRVEEIFKDFITKQAEEFNMDPRDLATMSQSELAMRMGNDQAMMSGWNKRKSRGKEDKTDRDGKDKDKEKKESKDKEKNSQDKVRELEFSSVRVSVLEGGQTGKFAKTKPLPPIGNGPDATRAGSGTSESNTSSADVTSSGKSRGRGRRSKASRRRVLFGTISEADEMSAGDGGSSRLGRGRQDQLTFDLSASEGGALLATPPGDPLSLPLQQAPPPRPASVLSTRSYSRASFITVTKRGRKKTTGRAQATREDKNEFLAALGLSASGHPTLSMLYFYKYLMKHGEEDGMPQIDKDLFFYIEVQKFKDGSHAFSDEEMLKRKVQSIVDCFLESVYTPTLQVDIPSDLHQRTLKAAQRYLGGKEVVPTLFDEAQFHVFKELLFYWAGYKRATSTPDEAKKRPVTKYDKMLRRRMENIVNYQVPSSDFLLPSIPEGAIPSFTISLSEGVKFKDYRGELEESFAGTPLPDTSQKEHRGSKATIAGDVARRSRGRSRSNSVIAR